MERTIVSSPGARPKGCPGTGLGVGVGVGVGLGLGLGAGVAAVTGMLLAPVKNDNATARRRSDLRSDQVVDLSREIRISATELNSAERESYTFTRLTCDWLRATESGIDDRSVRQASKSV